MVLIFVFGKTPAYNARINLDMPHIQNILRVTSTPIAGNVVRIEPNFTAG